jgi:hypothetical protein
MQVVSLCLCEAGLTFTSNHSLGRSLRRVSSTVLAVKGKSLKDMYQVLKYTPYTLIASSDDLHVLALNESGVTLRSFTQSKHMLLAELSVKGSPVLMVVGSRMSKYDVSTVVDKKTIPVLIAGTFAFNVQSKPALLWLDSLDMVNSSVDPLLTTQNTPTPGSILTRNVSVHGFGNYMLRNHPHGPIHIWSRISFMTGSLQ